jgi:predicted esterase
MNKYFIIIIIVLLIIILIVEKKKRLIYQCKAYNQDDYDIFYKKIILLCKKMFKKNYLTELDITTDNEDKIHGILIKNPKKEKYLIICHGNACNISDLYHYVQMFYPYTSIVLFDYTSYGKSKGYRPNEKIIKENVLSVWNYLTQDMDIYPEDISIMGESLGAAVAIWLTSFLSNQHDVQPNSVIIQSGFSSLKDMVPNYPIVNFLKFFMKGEYDSYNHIQKISDEVKVLIMHSTNDEMIPYDHGVKLYNAICSSRINLNTVKFHNLKGSHNNINFDTKYLKTIIPFII